MTKFISYAAACVLALPTIGYAEECFHNTSAVNSGQRAAYPANWDGSSPPIKYQTCSTQVTSYVNYAAPTPPTSTVAPAAVTQIQNTTVQTPQPIAQAPTRQPRQITVGETVAAHVAADVITYSILRAIFN